MIPGIRGTTQVIGILGYPVKHSLSPVMQNDAFTACGLDYVYVPFEVEPGSLAVAVAGLRALNVRGFNVTVPHKTQIIPFLDHLDESAVAAGAVNTVVNDSGCLTGFNTDGDGLLKSLSDEFGFDPHGASIAVLGAGGAARGAVASFCRAGVGRVIIANRTPGKAGELASFMNCRYPGTTLVPVDGFAALETELATVDLLLNTTSYGMDASALSPLNIDALPRNALVYDMIYAPPMTPLLRDADQRGLGNANGLGMLASQGEFAFMIWTGQLPPPGKMKSALGSMCPG